MFSNKVIKTIFTLSIILFVELFFVNSVKADQEAHFLPSFADFETSIIDGQAGVIRGIYAEDKFAFRVVQQPDKDPLYVSSKYDTVTDFQLAKESGNIGLLAHNYLAGKDFFTLHQGQRIRVIYGDGRLELFVVTKILSYKALQPKSPYSSFTSLSTGDTFTNEDVFKEIYQGNRHLTLQTCIFNNSEPSWGRLFVIAEPASHAAVQFEN